MQKIGLGDLDEPKTDVKNNGSGLLTILDKVFAKKEMGRISMGSSLYLKKYKQFNLSNGSDKVNYFKTLNAYKTYLKISFIGYSYFLRFYCLYFFWFLYYFNKIFFYFNRTLFNLWFRFFYFISSFRNMIDNSLFFYYKVLYKNLTFFYSFKYYFEMENIFTSYLNNILKVYYWQSNRIIYNNFHTAFYLKYLYIMFYFFYSKYYINNIFYNYNTLFKYSLNKVYRKEDNFFDMHYSQNYKYKNYYKLEYFVVSKHIGKKYKWSKTKKIQQETVKRNYTRIFLH